MSGYCRLLFLCAILCSCSFGGSPVPPPPELSPVPAFVRDKEPGMSGQVSDPAFGGKVTIRVEEVFTSARGESCKRGTAIADQREAEVVVVCRSGNGVWAMAPRVWGAGIEQSDMKPVE